jgi:hypothetical protein
MFSPCATNFQKKEGPGPLHCRGLQRVSTFTFVYRKLYLYSCVLVSRIYKSFDLQQRIQRCKAYKGGEQVLSETV